MCQAAAAPESVMLSSSHCSDSGSRRSSNVRSAEVEVRRIIYPFPAYWLVSAEPGSESRKARTLSGVGGAAFDQEGVTPCAAEGSVAHLGDALPAADDDVAVGEMELEACFVLGEDAGLDGPDPAPTGTITGLWCRWWTCPGPATPRCGKTSSGPPSTTSSRFLWRPVPLAFAGVVLSPAAGAVLMSVSTIVVALNAQLLRRLKLNPSQPR